MKKLRPAVAFEHSENFWSSENIDYNGAGLRKIVKHILIVSQFLKRSVYLRGGMTYVDA